VDFDVILSSGRIRARRWGEPGAPLLLCVPGLSANLSAFEYLAENLAGADRQVVAIDLRGCGRSEVTPPGSYGLDSHAADVLAVADAVAHRPQVLILDETQRGLDAANTARLEGLLAGERDRGAVTLVVCHDPDFVARNATHHIQIDGGRITLSGPALR